jgi:hypothetical protein
VRELWYWGCDEPDVIVDVSGHIEQQIKASLEGRTVRKVIVRQPSLVNIVAG